MEESGADRLPSMDGYDRSPAVRMSEEVMTAL